MTSGTKVFLALFAIIVGVLVVYYGVAMPGDGNAGASAGDGTGETAMREAVNGASLNQPPAGDSASAQANLSNPSQQPERDVPPPREPAPPSSQVRFDVTPNTPSSIGGLLTEGVSEARGEPLPGPAGAPPVMPGTQPGDAPSSTYLPLIGLNNPDSESSGGDAKSPTPAGAESNKTNAGSSPAAPKSDAGTRPDNPTSSNAPPPASPRRSTPERDVPQRPELARTEYIIQNGDTFVSIADEWFGDDTKWSLIARENPTVDPQRLKIGQKIFLPPRHVARPAAPVPAPDPALAPGQTLHVVESGDTLIAIARDKLGDQTRWEEIYALNKTTIGPDSAALQIGMKLKLPKK